MVDSHDNYMSGALLPINLGIKVEPSIAILGDIYTSELTEEKLSELFTNASRSFHSEEYSVKIGRLTVQDVDINNITPDTCLYLDFSPEDIVKLMGDIKGKTGASIISTSRVTFSIEYVYHLPKYIGALD